MTSQVQKRRGTTAEHSTFTGAEGEITVDISKDTAVVHDGVTAGGKPLAREDLTNVSASDVAAKLNGTTVSGVDINSGAIDGTPVGATTPSTGAFTSLSATGNIAVSGTVDGRDVATDGAKLDGIEAGADVTDTANVTAAGALMDSELTDITAVKAINQGLATSDNVTFNTVNGRDVDADGAKLDTIESGADVTDTANVTAAGALMDSELTDINSVKALNQGVATSDSPTFAGLGLTGSATISGSTSETKSLEIGAGRTGDGTSFIDLIGDTTYSDYGARFSRNPGANANTEVVHRGTGDLSLNALEAGSVSFSTSNTERMVIASDGKVGIGKTPSAYKLEVNGDIGFGTAGNGYLVTDSNWGVLLRADTASPAVAEYAFLNGSGTERMRINTSGHVTTPYNPAFSVTSGSHGAAVSTVSWATTHFNRGSNFSSTTFTAPVAGAYQFSFCVGGNYATVYDIYRNGGPITRCEIGGSGGYYWITANITMYLNVNDYVDVRFVSGSAGNLTANQAHFSGHFLG